MNPLLPVGAADFQRTEELLTLIIIGAISSAQIGDYLPTFGDIVIELDHGKPVNVRFERNHKPSKIEPPIDIEMKAE